MMPMECLLLPRRRVPELLADAVPLPVLPELSMFQAILLRLIGDVAWAVPPVSGDVLQVLLHVTLPPGRP